MTLLAIDTALSSLRLAVLGEGISHARTLDMARGQAEALFPEIDSLLVEAGLEPSSLTAIAVNIGPGSFTGTRVGVAAAKGLALALFIPLHGLTMFEAIAEEARGVKRMVVMDARRDEIYAQGFGTDDAPLSAPFVTTLSGLQPSPDTLLLGSAAHMFEGQHPAHLIRHIPYADPLAIARLASLGHGKGRTAPFYLRDADAKPQGHKVLPRKEG